MQTASPQTLLTLSGIRKSFEKDGRTIDVLRGVDLQMERGESLSIMGRSGAGKTTLLQIVGTLDRPSSGSIHFLGKDVFSFSDRHLSSFRGQSIGFVFQFHHLLPEFTTLENAAMPALIARVPRKEAMDRAGALLERVGLGHRLGHRPGELSGGEQQRVAVARALIMEPALLLADEPTGNLDVDTGETIFEIFREIANDLGTGIIVVTHSHSLAARMGRRLQMVDGQLVSADENEQAGGGE